MTNNNNSNNSEIMNATLTKRGFVSVWEEGGGATNTGDATIIARPDGKKPTAVYVRRSGHLSCGAHALIPVFTGYYVVKTWHHRGDFTHKLYQIVRTFTEGEGNEARGKLEVTIVNEFNNGEWDTPLAESLHAVIEAAEHKATCYHCREPHYVVTKDKE